MIKYLFLRRKLDGIERCVVKCLTVEIFLKLVIISYLDVTVVDHYRSFERMSFPKRCY